MLFLPTVSEDPRINPVVRAPSRYKRANFRPGRIQGRRRVFAPSCKPLILLLCARHPSCQPQQRNSCIFVALDSAVDSHTLDTLL
jgi:hypothetical protein